MKELFSLPTSLSDVGNKLKTVAEYNPVTLPMRLQYEFMSRLTGVDPIEWAKSKF